MNEINKIVVKVVYQGELWKTSQSLIIKGFLVEIKQLKVDKRDEIKGHFSTLKYLLMIKKFKMSIISTKIKKIMLKNPFSTVEKSCGKVENSKNPCKY